MAIDWKPESIKAAHRELTMYDDRSADDDMRAALDAAIEAQRLFIHPDGIEIAKAQGRAEAFEEAAKVVDDLIENDPLLLPRVAASIRALAKEPPK